MNFRLLLALIILEHQVKQQKGAVSETTATGPSPAPASTPQNVPTTNGNAANAEPSEFKYLSGRSIPQQPMFLAAILSALMMQVSYLHWK